jgi:hypothetical protein
MAARSQGQIALSTDAITGKHMRLRWRARAAYSLRQRAYSSPEEIMMPDKETLSRAARARRSGKSPSTQAGEFVREEIEHIREGKHGARSTKQAIAIGLSKARRAGVRLKPPAPGKTTERTRRSAERAYEAGAHPQKPVSRRRSRAIETALQREGHSAVSHRALGTQARRAAHERTAADRSASARRAART